MNKTSEFRDKIDIKRIRADFDTGLTSAQVSQRISEGMDNTPVEAPSKTVKEILADNIFTYFNLIFVILSVLLIIVGSYRDLTFMPIIIANALTGIIQELRSKSVLDKISVLNAPVTTVVRDGEVKTVPSKDLVLDDIVIFKAGNQISADAVVVDGNVSVNESLLTGESDEISKKPGDTLMSGSYIVSGSCRARLEKVGRESYISRLTIQAKKSKKGEQSEMIRSLNRIVKFAGFAIIPIGSLLFYQAYYINHDSIKESVQSMVAAVIGMIPEGLFLLASVALVISTMRLAMGKVLVHDMKCIEALARVDVLCVDKTGTITENTMNVSAVVPASDDYDDDVIEGLISDFAAAQDSDNETMAAIKNHFHRPAGRFSVASTGFSSEFKYSSVTFERDSYVIGAPEFVMKDRVKEYKELIESYSRKGYRVLSFVKYKGIPDGKALTADVEPICFVIMSNPIRKNAPETFRYFAEQGVEIKVISGDNPVTVSEVAKQAGIRNAGEYVDATTLTTDSAIKDAVKRYTVFGRVTPEQKRKFVRALKKAGKTVAMTGDGVNDVLALKDADCSVAMASGSDVAAQAAQLVLLESDFSKMPDVVAEGRKVVNNLERSGSLFIVKNIFSLIISVLFICFGLAYPLKPSQISLISMFTIGLPAFVLSLMPNRDIIRGRFIMNILLKALPAALTDVLVVCAMVYFGNIFNVAPTDIATASTILMSIVGMMIVFQICKPMDMYKMWMCIGCTVGLVCCMIFVSDLFAITSMSNRCILLCVNFSIIAEPCLRYLTIITKKVQDFFIKDED
ncbi:MAG: cation-translocating P-type ATPase [Ruminococcus sp.]|uniref:cation-translocating P-type ATPase n=1 Tax=Ruminococcus flavefaciens TaxID=1265 RepID=UPI0026EC79F2|nr:cation-translocating P-type ATPase [Ruminococcus flavefaciens]MBR0511961.1 cation-translocating P-type ATPase [Ruminococcus sp.]